MEWGWRISLTDTLSMNSLNFISSTPALSKILFREKPSGYFLTKNKKLFHIVICLFRFPSRSVPTAYLSMFGCDLRAYNPQASQRQHIFPSVFSFSALGVCTSSGPRGLLHFGRVGASRLRCCTGAIRWTSRRTVNTKRPDERSNAVWPKRAFYPAASRIGNCRHAGGGRCAGLRSRVPDRPLS